MSHRKRESLPLHNVGHAAPGPLRVRACEKVAWPGQTLTLRTACWRRTHTRARARVYVNSCLTVRARERRDRFALLLCAHARAAFKKFSPEIGKRKKRSSVSRVMTISDRFGGFPFRRSWIMDYKWNLGLVRGSGPIFRAGMARRACETLRVFPRPTSLRLRNDTSFREYSSCRKVFTRLYPVILDNWKKIGVERWGRWSRVVSSSRADPLEVNSPPRRTTFFPRLV